MSSKDLQVDWLRTFLAVVDTGSVTAAAKQVSRSQSAVSMQLKKLEDSVGRPLLHRGGRQMTLTPTGFDLLGHARQLMEQHTAALLALHGGGVSGRVSLGVPDDYAGHYLAPVLSTFAARHTDVELSLVCEPSTELLARLQRDEIDLALMTRDTPTRGDLLFKEVLVWAGSDLHQVWLRDPLPIALHGIDRRLRTAVIGALNAHRRAYRVVYNSPNIAGQLAVAAGGLAVAVIPRCSLPAGLRLLDGRHQLPELPELEVALVRGKQARRSAVIDALHEHLMRSLKTPA